MIADRTYSKICTQCGKLHKQSRGLCGACELVALRKRTTHQERPQPTWYQSSEWQAIKRRVLGRGGQCVNYATCGGRGSTVDHVVPIKQGGSATDESNMQVLCWSCHQRKRQREGQLRRQVVTLA